MAKRLKLKDYKPYSAYIIGRDDKDPIIDVVHTVLDDVGANYAKASEASGVSRTTLYNWIEGKTRRPQYATIAAVMGAFGREMRWVKKDENIVSIRKRKVA